jgi:hypothetical protein
MLEMPGSHHLPLIAVVVTALFPLAGFANETAYETVKMASHFAIGGVGVAGTITPEEIAMRQIRDGSQAETQLRKLLHESTPAGQMYALFALRQRDVADYPRLSESYRQSSTAVPTISGCIIHTQSMSEAVRWIDQYASKIRSWEKSGPTPRQTP